MVSIRCKMTVKTELIKHGLHCISLELGEVEIIENISPRQYLEIKFALLEYGLELIDNRKRVLIEKIKNVIIEMVHYSEDQLQTNFSDYLSMKLGYDYTYLANIFSEEEGITIEKFIISHKIEKAKELIGYDELNLTEIAWKLHYSSVAHLSNQFKKVTGSTPSCFKHLKHKSRIALENV